MNNQHKRLLKGTGIGTLIPFGGLLIFYLAKFTNVSIPDYISALQSGNILSAVISLCLIPNVILFFFYINRNRYKEGEGVILSMLIWGIAIFYFKFFA